MASPSRSRRNDRVSAPDEMPETAEERAERLQYRLRVEEAVIQASLLIASQGEVDLGRILTLLGESTGATHVYLQRVPPDDRPLSQMEEVDGVGLLYWTHGGGGEPGGRVVRLASHGPAAVEDLLGDLEVMAVPILSAGGRFHGYLGIANTDQRSHWRDVGNRILGVVGDMLAGYFERRRAEDKLQESEERWRSLVENHPEPILIASEDHILYVNPAGQRLLGLGEALHIMGRPLHDFVSAEEHQFLQARLRDLVEGKAVEPFYHEIARLDGEWRVVESHAVPVVYKGMPAAQLVMRDLTDRKKSEERYRTFIATISEGIWHVQLPEPIATNAIAELQAEHLHRRGVLAECNGVMAQMSGAGNPQELRGRPFWLLEPSFGLGEALVRSGYRVQNWTTTREEDGQQTHFRLNASGIIERGMLVGVWGSCTDVTETVELERRMVNALEDQQQQIGRELHDGVGQLLTGVRMLSQVLVESFGGDEGEAATLSRKIARFAEEASQQVRNIYYGLTPAQLSMEGLTSALEELVGNTDALPNVTCTFLHDGRTDVSELQSKLHLYRIVQEAINNALKHARATRIEVIFRTRPRTGLELSIRDNGVGLDPGKSSSKSLGLKSMVYRARAIGGDLSIGPATDGGTIVKCVLPHRLAE